MKTDYDARRGEEEDPPIAVLPTPHVTEPIDAEDDSDNLDAWGPGSKPSPGKTPTW
jgi:hypothetical protein